MTNFTFNDGLFVSNDKKTIRNTTPYSWVGLINANTTCCSLVSIFDPNSAFIQNITDSMIPITHYFCFSKAARLKIIKPALRKIGVTIAVREGLLPSVLRTSSAMGKS